MEATDFAPLLLDEAVAPTAAPARSAAKRPPTPLLEQLVREPAAFLARIDAPDAPALARALIATVAFGAGVFGAVVGAHRGGVQVLYCALKLPMVLLGTLVVCAPAFAALARATGSSMTPRAVIAVTLGASARFALVLAGLAPLLWLMSGFAGYHRMILATVVACGIAGLSASSLLFAGLARAGGSARLAGAAIVAVYALVGAQTSWLLRPYILRPRAHDVPFVRPLDGDLLGSVGRTARSAAGRFDRERAPLPGESTTPSTPVTAPAPQRDPEPRASGECGGASCD